jgi:hypothetical protein
MSRFLTQKPSSVPLTTILTDFYREEFLKHQRCLERQREYYSEPSPTSKRRSRASSDSSTS